MRRKSAGILCVLLALTVMLSGCSFTIGSKNKLSYSDTKIAGIVTGIDGKKIALKLGFITEPEGASDDSGAAETQQPEATDTTASAAPQPSETSAAVPPTVEDNSKAAGSGAASESVEPANAAENEPPEKPGESSAIKGVQSADTPVFTMGTTTAVLSLGDISAVTKEDGGAAALSDIKVGSILAVTLDAKGRIAKVEIRDVPRLITADGASYFSANEFSGDESFSKASYESTGAEENTVIVDDKAEVSFDGVTVSRASDAAADGDNASFYGVGAAILAAGGGKAYVKNSTVKTDAAGAAGIFAYGTGTIYAAGTKISTSKDTSGAIHAAGGGALYAWDLTADTQGRSSAAIRSDRGGGTIVADGGVYTTSGVGSPAVYCTANIAVNGAALTAKNSEAACVEGANSLYLFDSDVSGSMSDDEQNDTSWTVIVYQSTSGDAAEGSATFQMVGGSLKSANGGLFYTTNTVSNILLSDVDITPSDNSAFFLQCTGNTNKRGWGKARANGAVCTFTGIGQRMTGDVIWDSISKLDFYMQDGSTLTGAVKDDETWAQKAGGSGHCNMYISENSKWVVTGDSVLTSLYNEGEIVDADGNTVTIKNVDGNELVKGSSKYTVTVGAYGSPADFTGASKAASFDTFKTARPSGF